MPDARPGLPAIIVGARAGSLAHAWALFDAGGYAARTDDPAALAVKGRLLKDQALRLPFDVRADAFDAAAAAYAAADALAPQPYTAINVATLSWLAGRHDEGCARARDLIAWLDRDQTIRETPYWLAATRAEALLLCGDEAGAQAALSDAIAHDPDGWDDRASTLRQLRLILDAGGRSGTWLDVFRPPRSVYFAGHLGIAPAETAALAARVARVLDAEDAGFGFGALAAGADIVIAEALIAYGAALHVVLPTRVETFVAQSVAPYGAEWIARFDACLAAAESVQITGSVAGAYEPLASALGADIAMGSAVLNARRLESTAFQLLIADEGDGPYGSGRATARDAERWAATGRTQHVIRWPRTAPVVASGAKAEAEGRQDRRLAAMLHIAFDGVDALDEAAFAAFVDDVLTPFRRRIAGIAPAPQVALPVGNARIIAFESPAPAQAYAAALLAAHDRLPRLRIGGHYALAHWLDDPAALVGPGVSDLQRVGDAAIPGVLTVSEAMAAALFVDAAPETRAEHIGETATGLRLFAITN